MVTVLNDLAATGARPMALLDCVVAGTRELAQEILAGLRTGADLYGVPVLGGHATVEDPATAGLSTFAVGMAAAPLSARNARAGDVVSLAVCLEGEAMAGAEGSFFSHLRGPRRERAGRRSGAAGGRRRGREMPGRPATCRCRGSRVRCCSCARARAASAALSTFTRCPCRMG